MLPERGVAGRPRTLLMVGVPPLGPCPPHTSLRSALRSGRAAVAAAPTHENEPDGRSGALEEG